MNGGEYTALELKLRDEIERSFNSVIVPFAPSSRPGLAATGEPYVEFTGGRYGMFDEEAFGAALAAFVMYAAGKTGVLYWRVYPEIDRGRYYMRLLISDKAPLAFDDEMK